MKRTLGVSTVLFFRSPQKREWPAKEKLAGVYRYARARKWHIVTLDAPQSAAEAKLVVDSWRPLGCLVDMDASRRIFTARALGGVPAVFMDFDDKLMRGQTFRVNHDPEAVGRLAAEHLAARGLRHFAFTGYSREWAWSRSRYAAFRRALGKRAGRTRHFEFPAAGEVSVKKLADFDRFLSSLPRPCGMMLANDALAERLYPACARLGIGIPRDLAVVGVDDDERLCNNLKPTLSSIRLEFDQAGWLLAELLDWRLSHPSARPFVKLYGPLGIAPRRSTASASVRSYDPLADRVDAMIAEGDLARLTAGGVATSLGCSRRSAEMRYRAARGRSILEAITARRIEEAKKLLATTGISGAEVAAACGYARPAHFAARFKAATGLTMSAFRQRSP